MGSRMFLSDPLLVPSVPQSVLYMRVIIFNLTGAIQHKAQNCDATRHGAMVAHARHVPPVRDAAECPWIRCLRLALRLSRLSTLKC
jgi:hypothetical protein